MGRFYNEAMMQEALKKRAENERWLYFHIDDARGCTKGLPDAFLLRHGTMLAVELKMEYGEFTEEQSAFANAIGQVTSVVYDGSSAPGEMFKGEDGRWLVPHGYHNKEDGFPNYLMVCQKSLVLAHYEHYAQPALSVPDINWDYWRLRWWQDAWAEMINNVPTVLQYVAVTPTGKLKWRQPWGAPWVISFSRLSQMLRETPINRQIPSWTR